MTALRRSRPAAAAALLLLLGLSFVGRSVISSDGAEVVSETLGMLVNGEASFGRIPSAEAAAAGIPATHSMYGLAPSLVPLPLLAAAWPFRLALGPRGLDAAVALTWAAGACLCALAFGSLVRALDASASPLWAPAFLAGTFLWPYAADSFMEPLAGAALAAGAAVLVSKGSSRAWAAALLWGAACLLKPILWLTAPVFVLAAALEAGRRVAPVLKMLGALAAVVALQVAANAVRGAGWKAGYGDFALRFSTPLFDGLYGLVLSPGKGVLLYAPLLVAAALGAARLGRPARALLLGAPLVHLLVIARWAWWEGGSAWGPRLLLPVLPLACAAAVLAPRRLAVGSLVLGGLLNAPGILVSAGSWIQYAEALRPPPRVAWPVAGPGRVSTIPSLSPLIGHPWLAARNLAGVTLPEPWLAGGVTEGEPPPTAAASVSPWLLRRALGLPPIPPMIPRLLVRSAAGYLARGEAPKALPWAREAVRLSPADPDAPRVLAYAEAQSGARPGP
jgi:hypothetical protein